MSADSERYVRRAEAENLLVLLNKQTNEMILKPTDPRWPAVLSEVTLRWEPEYNQWVIESDEGRVNLDQASAIDDDGTMHDAVEALREDVHRDAQRN